MFNGLKSTIGAQKLSDIVTSYVSNGSHSHSHQQPILQLKSGQNNEGEEDDDLIDINDNDNRSEESIAGFRKLNFCNETKKESFSLRTQQRSILNQRVLVDDIGIFSDLEPQQQENLTSLAAASSSSNFGTTHETSSRLNPHSYPNHYNNHHRPLDFHHLNRNNNSIDSRMLNPNFENSNEDHQTETNNVKLINPQRSQSDGQICTSNSSSPDDHCHVSIDKDRNKTVWYKLITVFILCIMFMVGEIIGGILAKSISIQTDAAHMAADIAGFFFSILAIYVSEKEPTRRMSFGYYRSEVLGALFSILLIWLLTGVLVYLAIVRVITHDFDIEPVAMVVTASCGVFFNIIMFFILHTNRCFDQLKHHGHSHSGDGHGHSHNHGHGHSHSNTSGSLNSHGHSHSDSNLRTATPKFKSSVSMPINDNYIGNNNSEHVSAYMESDEVNIIDGSSSTGENSHENEHNHNHSKKSHNNINLRAAAIHVIGDFIQSVGVLVASIIIYFKPEFKIADPICTFIFSALVIMTTAPIIKDIYFVLMEGLPLHLNYNLIAADLCSLDNVKNAHNLHIWCLTMDKFVLAVHLVTEKNIDTQQVLRDANNMLRSKYKIERTIIQVEYFVDGMEACPQCRLPK